MTNPVISYIFLDVDNALIHKSINLTKPIRKGICGEAADRDMEYEKENKENRFGNDGNCNVDNDVNGMRTECGE